MIDPRSKLEQLADQVASDHRDRLDSPRVPLKRNRQERKRPNTSLIAIAAERTERRKARKLLNVKPRGPQ